MTKLVLASVVVFGCGKLVVSRDLDAPPADAPDTTLTEAPPALDNAASVTFAFTSDDATATFECRLDAAAFAACTSPHAITGFAEGARAFAVRAIAAGTVDPTPAEHAWTYDGTAPDTVIELAPVAAIATTVTALAFSSPRSAGGITFECALDGGAFAECTSPLTLTALTEAAHAFVVRARDSIGNVDPSPATAAWVVDLTAPDTQMTGPTGLIATTTATFGLTASEVDATFECKLDAAPFVPCTSPFQATGLAQGDHTMAARAIDRAGNVDASPVDFTFAVDSVAPNTTIVSGPPALLSGIAVFQVTSNEPGATFQCSQDGGAFAACPANHAISSADGPHTREIRAVDPAGNVDPSPATRTWTTDGTAPVITFTSGPANGATVGPFAEFVFTVDDGSPTTCRFDSGAFFACTSGVSANLPEGAHSFTIRAVDGLGNTRQIIRNFTVACVPNETGAGLLRFEETTGQIVLNSLASASGFLGDVATPDARDPARVATGRFGRALDFDAGPRDTVTWGTGVGQTTRHALEAWLFLQDFSLGSGGATVFLSEDARIRVWYADLGSTYQLRYSLTDGNGNTTTIEQQARAYGSWHHVLAYYDGARMQLWLDGSVVDTAVAITSPFSFGVSKISNPPDPVNGLVDEFGLDLNPLTTQQIKARFCPL